MNNIEILNENNSTKVSTQKITSYLIIFFAHVIKCISMSENRNKGWLSSIYNSSDGIRKIKKDSPAAYKKYRISENLEEIKEKALKEIIRDNKDSQKFHIDGPYEVFTNLDKVIDRNFIDLYLGLKL